MSFPARRLASALLCTALFASATALHAESKNPADYPLRLHIFNRNETSFYRFHSIDEAKGEGRANLFANGEVHGVDFNFDCGEKIKPSFGYETYPAKWKKQGKTLVVLMPVFGKSGSFYTCDFNTDVKDYAYISHKGELGQESPADFKAWMLKHQYDPEHGRNMPVKSTNAGAPGEAKPAGQ